MTTTRTSPRVLLAVLLTGCLNEDTFPRQVAVAACDRVAACGGDSALIALGGRAECVDDLWFDLNAVRDSAAEIGCSFKPDDAADCLERLETVRCEDFDLDLEIAQCGRAFGCTF